MSRRMWLIIGLGLLTLLLVVVCLVVALATADNNPAVALRTPTPEVNTGPPLTEPTVAPTEVTTTIRRDAEFAYPLKVKAGKLATVRFALSAPGSRAVPPPTASTSVQTPLLLNAPPGLTPYVSVVLDAGSMPVTVGPYPATQRLDPGRNLWSWQVQAPENGDFGLQPVVTVEYRDAADKRVGDAVPVALFEDYFTVQVEEESILVSVGGLISSQLGNAIALLLGLPGTIISVRSLTKHGIKEGETKAA